MAQDGGRTTAQVYGYFGPLTLLVILALPHAPLLDIATSYMLKDQLHASATEVSLFRLLTAVPVYLSVVFGLSRDLVNPLDMRDRGWFLLLGAATALGYFALSGVRVGYWSLFAGVLFVMFTFRFVSAAYAGLMALIGQEQLMSGRLAALWQIVLSVPYVVGSAAGGWVAQNLPPRETFLILFAVSAFIALYGLWAPQAVFAHAYDRPLAKAADLWASIVRLVTHRPAWPAFFIMLLWQFAPAFNAPMQFYLTDRLHASDAMYGYFNAVFYGAFVPMYFVYGWLCTRVSLEKLLWWGIIIAIPQALPLLFVTTPAGALWAAALMAIIGGIAALAVWDLAIRACPPGLQGGLMMLIDGANILSMRGGDMLGATVYNASPRYGFVFSVLLTMAVYAAILPIILMVPRALLTSRDGETNALIAAEEREAMTMGGAA